MKLLASVMVALLTGCAASPTVSESSALAESTPIADSTWIKYECNTTQGRQQGQNLLVDGKLQFTYRASGDTAAMIGLKGFMTVNYDFNIEKSEINNYLGVFEGKFENKVDYKGRVYKNHYKFENFDATITSNWDGGGMFGYLALSKDHGEKKIDAHYVFQAGDHIGGTIDMDCRRM
jgi:hypothetical protein